MKRIQISFLILLVSFNTYSSCKTKVNYTNGNSKVQTSANECDDGTISFNQPSSNGKAGTEKSKKSEWEGMCGPTAAANVFHAYCKNIYFDPTSISKNYLDDITPGVRPDTMKGGLNKMFDNDSRCLKGTWHYYYEDNKYDYVRSLYNQTRVFGTYWTRVENGKKRNISPLLTLISKSSNGEILHWVTVVDVTNYNPSKKYFKDNFLEQGSNNFGKCKVVYNEFGKQSEASCDEFAKYGRNVDNSNLTSILPEYIRLIFE
jgi:hypothetical protein